MFLSSQNAARTSDPYPCPECGEVSMVQVVETCHLHDGLTVRKLRHLKCQSCSARFFDDEAMHRIQAERALPKSAAQTR